MFQRLLLVACVLVVVALILYFFFWNRFIAFLIGLLIRVLYWNQEASSIWVEIGSIHFSLLAGRILIKDFRYHSSNQTIKIVKGQMQWRYWIRRPLMEEETVVNHAEDEKQAARTSSCRIQISIQGFEWLLYNRTAAYDSIISQMESSGRPASRTSGAQRSSQQGYGRRDTASPSYPPSRVKPGGHIPMTIQNAMTWLKEQLPDLDPKDLLPLGLEATRGAIICGNPSTPSLLIAEFQSADGTFRVVQSKSKHDLYKQVLALKFQRASIRLTQNEDYVDPSTTIGEVIHTRITQYSAMRRVSSYLSYRSFFRLWRQIKLYGLTTTYLSTRREQRAAQSTIASTMRMPKKAKKAIEDETPIGVNFSTFEYAVERSILETPILELSYYVDVVGEVPEDQEDVGLEPIDTGNGDTAPEWGFDLVIRGGFLRYGPWADRQRGELQRIFFPPTYQNSEVTPRLVPGDRRAWTALRVFVELRDETTLHIPFREASKDWQWDGFVNIPRRPRKREAASISLTVGDCSSINYVMPMVTNANGYESILEVHLDTVVITSSLNDVRLVAAESCRIRGELPAPLKWNGERTWSIAVFLRQPILYLLRDHINMFTDLGKDWASGPPTDWQRFVPTIYAVKLELHHYELNLYANDQNIIDKPLIRDENALITLRGVLLKTMVQIPSNTFRPESTVISFSVEAPDIALDFSLPRWNTHALHAPKEGHSLLKIGFLGISGSYRYYSEAREDYVEQLKLTFKLRDAAIKLLGWSIRYFMVLRDNYLGSFTHFSTLFEYLDKRKRGLPVGDPLTLKYREGQSNMLQVEMTLQVERTTILMPTGLLGCETLVLGRSEQPDRVSTGPCMVVSMPELQLQFRMHDYYMEMSLNIDTARGYIELDCPEKVSYIRRKRRSHKDLFLVDGVDITANRLFGPQPRTATYVCIWEIQLGHIKASLSASEAMLLAAAGNAFRVSFADTANAPASDYIPPVEPDVTFYKMSLAALDVTWLVERAAVVVSCPRGLKFDSNDLGAQYYRKVTSLRIPEASLKMLLSTSSERNDPWLEAAELHTDAYVDIYSAPSDYQDTIRAQLSFIEEQDKLTGRAQRLFAGLQQQGESDSGRARHKGDIYLPQPTLPNLDNKPPAHASSGRRRQFRDKPAIWRLSARTNASESDAEEGVSEADRDARLAKTRSLTPIPLFENDDFTTSSGEESDDADLTEGDSSDSDWTDLPDSSTHGITGSLLGYYSRLCRHYRINHSGKPILWEGPQFVLYKDRAPGLPHRSSVRLDNAEDDIKLVSSQPLAKSDGIDKNKDRTTFRIHFNRSIECSFTPLVVPAAMYLGEDLTKYEPGPELCIDSLMSRYLSSFSPSRKVESCTFFDIYIPSVVIHILQHITARGEDQSFIPQSKHDIDAPSASDFDITAAFDITMKGIGISGTVAKRLTTLKMVLRRFDASLDVLAEKHAVKLASPDTATVKICLYDLEVDVHHDILHVGGNLMNEVGHRGPELAVAAVVALKKAMAHLAIISRSLSQHNASRVRSIIHRILQVSRDKAILDPLSTIQPSYLVQSGTPRELRADPAFRFLFHLRNCLWNLDEKERDTYRVLWESSDLVPPDRFASLLELRLSLLDQDSYNLKHLSFLEALFPDLRAYRRYQPMTPLSTSYRINFASFHVGKINLAVLEPSGGPPTALTIINWSTDGRVRALDLIQFTSNFPTSMSQTSLRSKGPRTVTKVSASICVGSISLIIYPHLMLFAQHILRVRRHWDAKSLLQNVPTSQSSAETSSMKPTKLFDLDLACSFRRLLVQAAAENLILEFGVSEVQTISSFLPSQGRESWSTSHSGLFEEVYLQARSPVDLVKKSDQDILASLTFNGGKLSAVSRQDASSRMQLRLVFALRGLLLSVPRSALRLFRFIEEWRADFLPGIEATAKTLISELQAGQTKSLTPVSSHISVRRPILQIHGQVTRFEVSLQVMHGTWLSWEVNNTVAYMQTSSAATSMQAFGLQIASMVFNVSSKPNARDAAPSSRLKLVLPPLSLAGNYDGIHVHTIVLLEFIELKVKPSHWDTLLAVQQKFGQDFNDLVTLMQETRSKRRSSAGTAPKLKKSIQYGGFLKIRGFRVGLEGLSSTVFLECSDIGGGMNNATGWAWDIALSDLALSLVPRSVGRDDPTFSRTHRSAFVTIDFKIIARGKGAREAQNNVAQLSITRIHAVMQPSSIGEVGDFIDHLQAEILNRKEQRAIELEAFKERTRTILKTFDVNLGEVQLEESSSWLRDYHVKISIHSVGVAFPLTHDEDLELPRAGGRDSAAVRAFLFSIKSIEFDTHRGETGQAVMKNFSFVFTSRFRQSSASDFSSESHQTRNRLTYPEMKAQLRTSNSATSRQISIGANVSGFILDLDSTIPDYVFSLVDVYRQGKDRVERFSANIPRTPSSLTPSTEFGKRSLENHYTAIPTSNVFGSLTFLSGKVRVYSGSASDRFRSRRMSNAFQEPSDEQILEMGAEVFNLPEVSVWAEYRATPASQKLVTGPDKEPSILIFKSTVHSSQNTLRPKLLPFLTELVSHIEARMRKISSRVSRPPSLATSPVPNIAQPARDNFSESSSMQISFSLRIDRSRLELTCQPDVNVVAGLHWDSGGFVVNVSPGARKISFTGSVGGLKVGLKHGFLSEDCVKLDARNLAFSVGFNKMESEIGTPISSVSLVLDTEFHGGARFSRLQDILCFKAVWLDRFPVFNNTQSLVDRKSVAKPSISTPLSPRPPQLKQAFSTVILTRIRQIKLEVDLGQSISNISVDLKQVVLRSSITEVSNEVSVLVQEVIMAAKGNLSGHARVPNCVFQTTRRTEGGSLSNNDQSRMMELRLTSGALIASLESDHQKLLHYRAEPLEVEIYDDWSMLSSGVRDELRPLQLSFTVTSPEIVAVVMIGTIPKLMSYANKFKANLDAQRQGASLESELFRATRSPKPDNPLSAVAEAMLHSARSRFKEAEAGLSYVIMQHMSLRLNLLRLVVFPRTIDDPEIAQFIGRDVRARLDRLVASDTQPAKRDLHLSFSSMVISKFTQAGHGAPVAGVLNPWEGQDGRDWLAAFLKDATEAIIVGLPSMKMHMVSEEIVDGQKTGLVYDFHSQFVRKEGMKAFEDIYITLNVSLYSWLTVLRKNLTREMDQVKATEDWRTSLSTSLINSTSSRGPRKLPEPLSLASSVDTQKSSTLPSPAVLPFLSPASAARYPAIGGQSRSSTGLSGYDTGQSPTLYNSNAPSPVAFPSFGGSFSVEDASKSPTPQKKQSQAASGFTYKPRTRHIERLTMRQLGEATPDVMHPFFMKKAGFNLEDSLPQYVNEYATVPLEEIMDVLLKLYSRQLLPGNS